VATPSCLERSFVSFVAAFQRNMSLSAVEFVF
jgi:hypothetical protein